MIRKNPFDFQLVDVIINDSIRREALSREDQKRFMDFIQNDLHFCKYYDAIFVLLNTGLRISEFCGLTVKDVNLKKGYINIERQLQKRTPNGYYIEKTKTDSGNRQIPMTPEVQECMQRILNNRKAPAVEPMIDGITGFLFFDKNGKVKDKFPKETRNSNGVCHVRPHARVEADHYELPVPDKETGITSYTKQSFWFNKDFIERILEGKI